MQYASLLQNVRNARYIFFPIVKNNTINWSLVNHRSNSVLNKNTF